jgi:hypothetical protein
LSIKEFCPEPVYLNSSFKKFDKAELSIIAGNRDLSQRRRVSKNMITRQLIEWGYAESNSW